MNQLLPAICKLTDEARSTALLRYYGGKRDILYSFAPFNLKGIQPSWFSNLNIVYVASLRIGNPDPLKSSFY